MEEWTQLFVSAWEYMLSLNTPNFWVQIGSLAVFAALAKLINRYWTNRFMRDGGQIAGARRFTLHSIKRIVFPLSMMFMVLIAREVMQAMDMETLLFNIAIPLLFSLGLIRLTVYTLRVGFSPGPAVKALENVIATLVWMAVALHLLGWLGPVVQTLDSLAITLGESRISLWSVGKMVVSLALFLVLALWLSRNIEKRLSSSQYLAPGMRVGLAKVSQFGLLILAGIIALNTVGIDLTALTVFGGALGVGLGLGLQRIASNYVSGFILIFDRSIRPGDVISIDSQLGWIQEMRARYVVMQNRGGVNTIIPNENLIISEVINWSYGDPNVRLKIPVQISYDNNPEQAMALMEKVAADCPRILTDPPPAGRLVAFGDNGIDLELLAWINDPQQGIGNIRSQLNIGIWRAFRENSITIPYPQRDLYLKSAPANLLTAENNKRGDCKKSFLQSQESGDR